MFWLTTVYNYNSQRCDGLFGPLWALHTGSTHKCMHVNILTHKAKNIKINPKNKLPVLKATEQKQSPENWRNMLNPLPAGCHGNHSVTFSLLVEEITLIKYTQGMSGFMGFLSLVQFPKLSSLHTHTVSLGNHAFLHIMQYVYQIFAYIKHEPTISLY